MRITRVPMPHWPLDDFDVEHCGRLLLIAGVEQHQQQQQHTSQHHCVSCLHRLCLLFVQQSMHGSRWREARARATGISSALTAEMNKTSSVTRSITPSFSGNLAAVVVVAAARWW